MNTYKPDYVARKETKNVILRPQVSPKNPKSWGQPQTKSRQFITNQRLINLRVAEREATLDLFLGRTDI